MGCPAVLAANIAALAASATGTAEQAVAPDEHRPVDLWNAAAARL